MLLPPSPCFQLSTSNWLLDFRAKGGLQEGLCSERALELPELEPESELESESEPELELELLELS